MAVQELTSTIAILAALRIEDLSLQDYIATLEKHFESLEPDILAFLPEADRFERLRHDAEALAEQYPDVDTRPPLFGLPIGVKDIFHVDGFPTRAGSNLPIKALAGYEAECITMLKDAGALILGKTATTEFAYFAPGHTRNPHNFAHTPGGSSSGSAAAVAAGLSPLTLGTQTIGSVSRPASFCGVFGFKPSYDRISKHGVIPLAPSVDHVGLFASDLEIMQLSASLLCKDWRKTESSLSKPVLGIPEGPYLNKASNEMIQRFNETCILLKDSGYEIHQVEVMPDIEEIIAHHKIIVAAEAAQTHKDWYANYSELYHSKTAELIEIGQKISDSQIGSAIESLKILRGQLSSEMESFGIDVWLSPAALGAAPRGLESTGDPVMNLPWTHAGLPTLALPSGDNQTGLPLGLQLAAGWYQDENLFDWAKFILADLI